MAVMVLDVTWQVTSRFLIRAPSSFTEELAGFLLIWIGLFGAAYGIRTRAHLGIDLLVARLSVRPRRAAEILAHLVVFLFALTTMTLGGLRLVRLASQLDQISASMGVGMWVVYLALPLSGLLIMVFSLEAMVGDRGSRERA
jgi:TRAP-type C4-dicarboxylate transport system permease small subunit